MSWKSDWLLLAVTAVSTAFAEGAVPVYEADFSAKTTNVEIVNFEGRTPFEFREHDGRPAVVFSSAVEGKRVDTMWGAVSHPFAVTPGDEYFVQFVLAGDLPGGTGLPGASIAWIGADGKKLMTQDAKGKKVPLANQLKVPTRRPGRGKTMAWSRGVVPNGAVRGKISYKIDRPDLGKNRKLAFLRMAYYEHRRGEKFAIDDIEPPTLKMLNESPSRDFSAPLKFRLEDASGINWSETSIKIDGQVVPLAELGRDGEDFVYRPNEPWAEDSLHRVEVEACDRKGNFGSDCGFVAFTRRRLQHPKCSIRDDGMLLVDSQPRFMLGWARVRPCEGNGYSLARGLAEMKANGMNTVHTYLVGNYGPKVERELFEQLVEECGKQGMILYAEPYDRKPYVEKSQQLMAGNLFRARDWKMPILWGIGDDTSMYFSPSDIKFLHRFCKAVDPAALTVSADVATGPGGHTPYAPFVDALLLESYPITETEIQDNELATAAENLDYAWSATLASQVPNRMVALIPQAFKGWTHWRRLPTAEEIRAQAYLAIAGGARGLVYYASTGSPVHLDAPPPPGTRISQKNFGPLDSPETKAAFFALTRELAAILPSLALRDAKVQPQVEIVKGNPVNGLGSPTVRCILKEDGLLVAANSSHLAVTAEFTLADGRKLRHEFARNGTWVERVK